MHMHKSKPRLIMTKRAAGLTWSCIVVYFATWACSVYFAWFLFVQWQFIRKPRENVGVFQESELSCWRNQVPSQFAPDSPECLYFLCEFNTHHHNKLLHKRDMRIRKAMQLSLGTRWQASVLLHSLALWKLPGGNLYNVLVIKTNRS